MDGSEDLNCSLDEMLADAMAVIDGDSYKV